MKLRDATPDDLAYVSERSISRGVKEHPQSIDLVYALEDDAGAVLVVGGMKLIAPGVGWAWLDFTDSVRVHKYSVIRVVRDWLLTMMRTQGLHRVMASVREDFPEAISLVEHLGFKAESTMWRFFGDADGLMYSIVKEPTDV